MKLCLKALIVHGNRYAFGPILMSFIFFGTSIRIESFRKLDADLIYMNSRSHLLGIMVNWFQPALKLKSVQCSFVGFDSSQVGGE